MTIYLASDHAGIDLKKTLSEFLIIKNISIVDLGPNNTDSVDYSDYAKKLCEKVLDEEEAMGVLICGTGIGMSISANRFKGIRASLCTNTTMARFSRAHNDSNVLCLGSRIVGTELAKDILEIFISSNFEYGRHKNRIEKIETCNIKNTISPDQLENVISHYSKDLEEIEEDYNKIIDEINKTDE